MKIESFNSVYDRYHRLSLKVAFDVVQNHELSQDVCQEVFVLLYEKMDELDEELIKFWILVNSRRKALDMLRKTKSQLSLVDKMDREASLQPKIQKKDEVLDNLIMKEFLTEIFRELNEKNPMWCDMYIKIYIENKNPKDVALEYGITLANLRTKICRANLWIQNKYGEDYEQL